MKKFSYLVFSLALVAFLASCGKKPKAGQYAYCNFTNFVDTTIVFSSSQTGDVVRIPVKSKISMDSTKDKLSIKLNETLLGMKVGDTTTIDFPIDDNIKMMDPRIPKTAKNFRFGIRLVAVADEKQFLADREADRKKQEKKDSLMRIKAEGIEKEMKVLAGDSTTVKARAKKVADSVTLYQKKYLAGELNSQIKTTTSGLKYLILNEGTGELVKNGYVVAAHYYGALAKDGKRFDDSYSRGQFMNVIMGENQVIKGWEEGLKLLKGGSTALIFIPSNLGYGEQGNEAIPANSELIFYTELLKGFPFVEQR